VRRKMVVSDCLLKLKFIIETMERFNGFAPKMAGHFNDVTRNLLPSLTIAYAWRLINNTNAKDSF
jgi:hypothetical protein